MSTSIDSVKAFTDAIKKMAADECEKINRETRQIRTRRIRAAREDAENRYSEYVNYEIKRILREKNKEISLAEEASRKNLAGLRKELTDKVFSKVTEDLAEFTKTQDYRRLLIDCAGEIYGEISENDDIEFFVRKEDMAFKDELCNAINKDVRLSCADDIKIGGIKAINHTIGCLYDNSFDIKLEEQRTRFIENSGLKI